MSKAGLTKAISSLIVAALLATSGAALALGQGKPGPITPPSATPPKQAPSQAPPPQQPQQPQEKPPQYSVQVQTQVVNMDVVVTDDNGNPIPGLKEPNFKVLVDNQPQTISNFAPSDAPITIVILMEFSQLYYGWFAYTGENWAYSFLNQLRPQDWVALVTFDLRPKVLVDFTHNSMDVRQALQTLYFPGFREADLYDSVLDTLNRLKDVKGKKSILIIASGLNTFSRVNLDQVLSRLKETETTIFAVSVAEPLYQWADARGMLGSIQRLDFLQAENQMGAFARMTGGRAWFPRFDGEMPGIFQQVVESLRYQYSMAFSPTTPNDGKYHKIKVELVAPNGQPLIMVDQRKKKVKYHIYAREGFMAPKSESAAEKK
ncbi:MAG: VWA domain-containing protein [Acidobacteriota bacterium]|nr:VWA domain-containing protein [Acidobacteriota bacterium]